MKCPHCNKLIENRKWLDIPELGIKIEKEVHDKNKSWDDLELDKREKELLTIEQCIFLANSKYSKVLKMDGSSSEDDFFIQQPFKLNKKNGYVARFSADDDRADFYCYGDPSDRDSVLGVRFCKARKVVKK